MDLTQKVKELNKVEFNPMQKKALDKGLFDSNVIISSPTASGKTLISEIIAVNSIIKNKKKVIYACPLKALASEHFNEFKKKYSKELNIKATISTGDFDSGSRYLQNYDIIFTTYEKTESLLRHKAEWLSLIGLLVVDEIHEIDSNRGPTIEIMITKLRLLNPKMQVLGLSATIPNAKELAKWLDAKLIESSFRPVKLNEGVFFENEIHFLRGKEKIRPLNDGVISLSIDAIKKGKQALVFCNTRPVSIGTAKKLAKTVEKNLLEKERKFLSQKSFEILNALENPTEQCRILSNLVKSGVAFHNAGMLPKQRGIIEDLFRKRVLKVISATTTLSAGLNLPAFRVIIPSVYRYTAFGSQKIPVREYKQWAGRCVSGETVLFKEDGLPVTIEEFSLKYFNENEIGSKELKGNEKVLSTDLNTFKPKFASVQKIWKRKVNKLVEIETKSGKKVRVSEDHPLLSFTKIACGKASFSKVNDDRETLYKKVIEMRERLGWGAHKIAKELNCVETESMINHWIIDGNKHLLNPFKWKKAKDVHKGKGYSDTDYLSSLADFGVGIQAFTPRDFLPYESIVQINEKTFMSKQGHKKCDFPKEWSENLCRFIAKIMSDGSIYYDKKDNSYLLRYYNKHLKVQKEYQRICFDLFNKKPPVKWRRGSYQAGFKSMLVGKFLENIGVPSGKKSFVLRVPKPIFSLPKNLIKSFIREYSFCDGWETKSTHNLITSSKKLAYDFALLFSSIGYLARVQKKKPNTFRENEIWEISVTKSQFDKDKKLNSVGNIFPDLIKSKKTIKGDFYVYDLTLNPTHNFVANGLIVHNSGRPKFDSVGESVLIAGNEFEADELKEEFILGDLEDVSSKLGIEPVLRTHVLAAIATGFAFDLASLEKFFSGTFYAHQFNGLEEIFLKINSVLKELREIKFIEGTDKHFKPTLLGKRIAELYLDPLSAKMILDSFEKNLTDFSFLFLLTSSFEFYPLFSVPKSKEEELWAQMNVDSEKLSIDLEQAMFSDVSLLKKYNSALLLQKWIQECPEESMRKEFNVQPGILHSKLMIADWLLYCFSELALISGKKSFIPLLSKLRKRMKYGVKEELLMLTELKGIGRMRARKLFNSNLNSIASLKKTELKNLAGILGKETAFKIKRQLGQMPKEELNSINKTVSEQTDLASF